MKIIIYLLLCIISTQLFASFHLATIYKEKGIEEVQKELEQQFTTKDFWTDYLQNIDISNGYYESIKYTLISNPNTKMIYIFKNDKKDTNKIFETTILTGKNSGAKSIEGDLKTPVGSYDLTNKLTTIDQFYGPLALVTNYPNSFDKINGRTGDGIWIHGVPLSGEREQATKGCIALDNKHLIQLDQTIDFTNSVLILESNTTSFPYSTKEEMANILSNLYLWKSAWEKGDFNTYISFYSPNFRKTDGSDIKKFTSYKKSIFDKKEEKQIIFKDINVIPYPNEESRHIYKIKYYQVYSTKSHYFKGIKELYIELLHDKFSILSEG